ncbi:hypothetical protein [Simiduia aestuariiviva]|uniref:Uncharacterized protein n=1 Tax=Simiduia aestuariiviva TaxID=1510459 RepID=A0A839URS4_9GAMM|nr:hypothetical protein [Simiduia aestuariiviva]MBB3168097.1 hypothetical protein [Simiduia aestuariiviva]
MSAALFGQFLLEQERINVEQFHTALAHLRRKNKSLGELAVDSRLMTEREVAQLNREQRNTDLMLGELAVHAGLLTEPDLERLLILQQATRVNLTDVLVELGYIGESLAAELTRDFSAQQRASRTQCERELKQIPQSESLQLCLNELIKSLQRICRQSVVIQRVYSRRELQKRLPYVVLQQVSGDFHFHFGMALAAQQVQRISSSLSGEPIAEGYIPVAAMERFSDIVIQNACEKFVLQGRKSSADKPKAFFVGDHMPACKDLIGVQMRSDDGDFDAVFFAS